MWNGRNSSRRRAWLSIAVLAIAGAGVWIAARGTPGPVDQREVRSGPIETTDVDDGPSEPSPGVAGSAEKDEPTGLVVFGVVRDAGGSPFAGARIVVAANQRVLAEAVSDERGAYEAIVPAGATLATKLALFADARERARYCGVVSSRGRTTGRLRHDVELVVVGGLSGTVRDPEGDPVPGATVYLVASDELRAAREAPRACADESGVYWLPVDDDVTTDVGVFARGFAPRIERDVPISGSTPRRLDVSLDRGLSIGGTVVDESGAPLAAGVFVSRGDPRMPVFWGRAHRWLDTAAATSDEATGAFRIDGLGGEGEYVLNVNAPLRYERPRSRIVRIGDVDVRIVLLPETLLRFRLVDARSRAPIEWAKAFAFDGKVTVGSPLPVSSDAGEGERFLRVPPDRPLRFVARGPDHGEVETSVPPLRRHETRDLGDVLLEPLDVERGKVHVELVWPEGVGRGEPLSAMLYPVEPLRQSFRATSNVAIRFDVPVGRYRLRISFHPSSNWLDVEREIDVEPGRDAVRVELERGGRIRLVVGENVRGWPLPVSFRSAETGRVAFLELRDAAGEQAVSPLVPRLARPGRYLSGRTPPGRYRLSVGGRGFDVVVEPGRTVEVDVTR